MYVYKHVMIEYNALVGHCENQVKSNLLKAKATPCQLQSKWPLTKSSIKRPLTNFCYY